MENKKILYLYTGDHPVHREFAKQITTNFAKLSLNVPRGYAIYFIEGSYVLPWLLKKTRRINKKAKIIILFADPRLYYLNKKIRFSYKKKKLCEMSLLRQRISKIALQNIDGAICEGDVNFSLFKKFCPKKPIKKIVPFIWNGKFGKLKKVKPKLGNKNILFVGNGPDKYCKGLGFLISIFPLIKKGVPIAELYIYGGCWDKKKFPQINGMHFCGEKNIIDGLNKYSLLAHLGQGEGYGINVLESMLAGVPVIVSEATGAKEAVACVDKNFVVPLDKEKASKKIINYFLMDISQKKILSKRFREEAKKFKEADILKFFKKQFESLIKEIYGGN